MRGTSDSNISFAGLCELLKRLGFSTREKGSHHIFFRDDVAEILNIQPKGANARAYQVKQIRKVILKYRLGGFEDDQV
jgi:predicted RNA binding protein YcfA (HicA-like mRNA interferase family)